MKIFFVGGTRFIGRVAVERATRLGHGVVVFHRGVHTADLPGAVTIQGDRQAPELLRRALEERRPDVIVDTFAMSRKDAQAVVDAASGLEIPLVVLSSQDVYAQFGRLLGLEAPDPQPVVKESSPLTIPFPFRDHPGKEDYDKKEVEAVFQGAVEEALPGATVLRLPATYGRKVAAFSPRAISRGAAL